MGIIQIPLINQAISALNHLLDLLLMLLNTRISLFIIRNRLELQNKRVVLFAVLNRESRCQVDRLELFVNTVQKKLPQFWVLQTLEPDVNVAHAYL